MIRAGRSHPLVLPEMERIRYIEYDRLHYANVQVSSWPAAVMTSATR